MHLFLFQLQSLGNTPQYWESNGLSKAMLILHVSGSEIDVEVVHPENINLPLAVSLAQPCFSL